MSQPTETKDPTKLQKWNQDGNESQKSLKNATRSSAANYNPIYDDDEEEEELEMHSITKRAPNFDFEDDLDFRAVNSGKNDVKSPDSQGFGDTQSVKMQSDYDIHKQEVLSILEKIKDPKGLVEAFEKYQPKHKEITVADIKASTKTKLKRYKDCIYFGEIINSNRHGKGIMVYGDTRVYEGEWANDLKHGKGLEILGNGNRYEGQFLNGKPEGVGSFLWMNGETYEGEWKNGLKHGSGMWMGMRGESYIGEWKNGKVDGYGVHTWRNGDRYEGQLKGFLKHGHGTEKFINGDFYVGNYVNGKPDGYGEYYWVNGCQYKGTFKNGLRHGKGTWKKAENSDLYEGEWINDKKCGEGAYTWASGNSYKGEYFNDMRHGTGEMLWVDGSHYKGQWEKGIQHGEGELFVPDKGLQKGTFVNNTFVSAERGDTTGRLEPGQDKGAPASISQLSVTQHETEGNDPSSLKGRGRLAERSHSQVNSKGMTSSTGKYHVRNDSSLSKRQAVAKLNPLREKTDINFRQNRTPTNYELSQQAKKNYPPPPVWKPSGKVNTTVMQRNESGLS